MNQASFILPNLWPGPAFCYHHCIPALAKWADTSEECHMPDQKTILVVDDDMELSDGLRVVLERQGYRVIQARDGQQGKQRVYEHRPDLVILDMMMPRMGGYPVLEHFKDKADAPPIIMITANEGSRHKAYAEYLGVVDYLRKPFAMERLLEAVDQALKGGAAEQQEKKP